MEWQRGGKGFSGRPADTWPYMTLMLRHNVPATCACPTPPTHEETSRHFTKADQQETLTEAQRGQAEGICLIKSLFASEKVSGLPDAGILPAASPKNTGDREFSSLWHF